MNDGRGMEKKKREKKRKTRETRFGSDVLFRIFFCWTLDWSMLFRNLPKPKIKKSFFNRWKLTNKNQNSGKISQSPFYLIFFPAENLRYTYIYIKVDVSFYLKSISKLTTMIRIIKHQTKENLSACIECEYAFIRTCRGKRGNLFYDLQRFLLYSII